MRVIVENHDDHENNGFTQGSIFSCLETSAGIQCYGVVITARCDIEHDKLNKVVCLPMYELNQWMQLYGNDEIYRKSESSVLNQFNTLLNKYKLNVDNFRTFGSSETLKVLNERSIKNTDLAQFTQYSSFLENKDIRCGLKNVIENNKKYLESLISHSKADVYFAEGLLGDNSKGFVIDLGEPISLPMQTIKDINKIIYFQKYNRGKNKLYKNMVMQQGESSKFSTTILSPYIEHILQRFSQFYSRIGTDDINLDTLEIIKDSYENR